MKRTTIFIPESLERDLHLLAGRRRQSAASIAREALAAYVAENRSVAALPSFTGAFDSGHTDTAERHDDLLFGTLSPHDDAAQPVKRARPRRRAARAPRPR